MLFKMKIKYNKTGQRARAHLVRYNGTEGLDRQFNIVPAQELRDVNKKYYVPSPDGKYLKTKFAIGFEVEKLTVHNEEEYPIFRGYERDSSVARSPRSERDCESITNILPLVPNSNLKNKIMDLMAEARPILDAPVDAYCGGHINLSAQGMSGRELKAALKPFSGLIYAMYKGRLKKRYGNGDMFLNNSGYWRGVINAKSKVAEYRFPSAVPSTESLMKRYSLFFELMDTAVHRPRTRFNTFLERVRPILMRMYDQDAAKVEEVFQLARDFQRMLDKGRVTRRILPYLPDDINSDISHYGRYRAISRDGEVTPVPLRVDRQ
jgi:hypothetical protein